MINKKIEYKQWIKVEKTTPGTYKEGCTGIILGEYLDGESDQLNTIYYVRTPTGDLQHVGAHLVTDIIQAQPEDIVWPSTLHECIEYFGHTWVRNQMKKQYNFDIGEET